MGSDVEKCEKQVDGTANQAGTQVVQLSRAEFDSPVIKADIQGMKWDIADQVIGGLHGEVRQMIATDI